MNDKLDPTNNPISVTTELAEVKPAPATPVVRKTLPAILDSWIKPGTLGGDLCKHIVFPVVTNGVYKAAEAILRYIVLGQDIKPSGKSGSSGTYIYTDRNGNTDYTVFSQGRTQATIIDSNGVTRTISNDRHRSSTSAIFKLRHYSDDDSIQSSPIPWTWGDVEAKQEQLNDSLSEAIYASGWASVQDVYSAAGLAGAPPTANKWGWRNIAKMSVQLDPDDNTILVINMGSNPQPIQ